MNVKVININRYNKKTEKGPFGYFRGYADIRIEDEQDSIDIKGLNVFSNGKGNYCATIPRDKGRNGKYYDFICPSTLLLMAINIAIEEAYKEATKPYKSPI